jgi:POT family proton-dependent oligopeptide transporter
MVLVGSAVCAPVIYFLLSRVGADQIQIGLSAIFVLLMILMVMEGIREGKVQRDKVLAMTVLFIFNIFFWCFFEQAGSSLNFLAENIVNRKFGNWEFPIGWFQSINPIAIVVLAPLLTVVWGALNRMKAEPSISRKFGLGLIFNGLAFTVLMFALTTLVQDGHIPLWPLALTYVIQTVGELCLSPIGLSMVTKLAPLKSVGLAMGGWFLSISIGNNLSGIVAAAMSGETGLTTSSAPWRGCGVAACCAPRSATTASHGSGCSRPCANTPASGLPPTRPRTTYNDVTARTTWPSPRTPYTGSTARTPPPGSPG